MISHPQSPSAHLPHSNIARTTTISFTSYTVTNLSLELTCYKGLRRLVLDHLPSLPMARPRSSQDPVLLVATLSDSKLMQLMHAWQASNFSQPRLESCHSVVAASSGWLLVAS